MADSTSGSQRVSREEAAEMLEAIASELRRDDEEITVDVGNKSVSLSPRKKIDYEIEVRERSSMLRSKRESIGIDLKWKAKK